MAPCGTPSPATIQYTMASETSPDTAVILPVIIKVINPGSTPVNFIAGHDDIQSTAVLGTDWSFVNQQFSNSPGISYDTVFITVIPNTLVQPTVKAVISFYNVSSNGIVIPDSSFTLYITNTNLLTVSFLGAGFSYVKDTSLVEVKVTISSYSAVPISANVTLAPGSAVNGTDFTFNDTTVTFPAYSIDTQGVWVHILNNPVNGPNKQANFNLAGITGGAQSGITAYTLTIINVDTTSGISEVDFDKEVKIFPNPAIDELNIQTEKELLNVEIVDLMGRVVFTHGKLNTGKNILNLSLIPAGMYFMNLKDNDRILSKRFVKL